MRINEITRTTKNYELTVRCVANDIGSGVVKTVIQADSSAGARLLAGRLFGKGNVLSIREVLLSEKDLTEADQAMTADQMRIQNLKRSLKSKKEQKERDAEAVKTATLAVKREQAQQALKKIGMSATIESIC